MTTIHRARVHAIILAVAACQPSARLPVVAANDNREPAGEQRNDTLTLRLAVRMARWFPEAGGWRVINASIRDHPMHLHGFYFDVESYGDAWSDTTYSPESARLEPPDEDHAHALSGDVGQHMAGLVLGIEVAYPPGMSAPPRGDPRRLRVFAQVEGQVIQTPCRRAGEGRHGDGADRESGVLGTRHGGMVAGCGDHGGVGRQACH